jgi:hypothetical protein
MKRYINYIALSWYNCCLPVVGVIATVTINIQKIDSSAIELLKNRIKLYIYIYIILESTFHIGCSHIFEFGYITIFSSVLVCIAGSNRVL